MFNTEKKMVWSAYKVAKSGGQSGVSFPGLGFRVVFVKVGKAEDVGRHLTGKNSGKLYAKNRR